MRTNCIQIVYKAFGYTPTKRDIARVLCGQYGRGRRITAFELEQAVKRVNRLYPNHPAMQKWFLLLNGLQGNDPWALRPTAAEEREREAKLMNPWLRARQPEDDEGRLQTEKKRQLEAMRMFRAEAQRRGDGPTTPEFLAENAKGAKGKTK